MKKIILNPVLYVLALFTASLSFMLTIPTALAATSPSLGTASTYGVLADTFNYNIGLTTILGTAGQSALGYVGAFPGGGATLAVTGDTEVNNAARTQAGLDQNNALNNVVDGLNTQVCTSIGAAVDLAIFDMDGAGPLPPGTYTPGCYSSTGAMSVGGGGTVTLSGPGTFIFRPVGALDTSANSIVQLAAGASECDVFWAPTAATTLGADSTFVGYILDAAGITIGNNVSILGSALAYGGTVTADTDTITVPVCTAAPATLHVVKNVVNDNTGVAIASDFNLHVTLLGVDVAGSPAAGAVGPVGTTYSLSPDTYVVSEDAFAGYTTTYGGDCDATGNIILASGADLTCTVTNNDIAPAAATISVVKTVINDNGRTKVIADFPLFVNAAPVVSGVVNAYPAPAAYTVTETVDPNYTRTFSGDCDTNGAVNLVPGDNKICIVTNNDIALPSGGGGGGGYTPPVPPHIAVVKVPDPLALPAGPGEVTYTYTLNNTGTVAVSDITMVGDTCSPITLVSGDIDTDSRLDVDETWTYTCSTTLSETHTNTVTATGWANGISAVDIASATVVVGAPQVPPLIHVTKVPNPLILPVGGGMVTYTEKITNPGTVALSNVKLTDDKCSPMKYVDGDTNVNLKLEPNETWTYTCQTNLSETTLNTATATGEANGITIRDFALATVVVPTSTPTLSPAAPEVPKLPRTGVDPGETAAPWNIIAIASIFAFAALINVKRKKHNN